MLFLIFLISLICSFVCMKTRRKASANKRSTYFVSDRALEFMVPLTIVSFFYAVLGYIVDGTSDQTTLQRLEALQSFLSFLKSVISQLKLTPLRAIMVLLVIVALDLFLLRRFRTSPALRHFKNYQKWSRRTYIVIVLLCSFALFGNQQLDHKSAHVRVRIDKIEGGFAKVRQDTEGYLFTSVQKELVVKIRATFPSTAINYAADLENAVKALNQSYNKAKEYGIDDVEAANLINSYGRTRGHKSYGDEPIPYVESVAGAKTEPTDPADEVEATSKIASPPLETSVESLEKADAKLRLQGDTTRSRGIAILELESGKELLVQFPKILTGAAKSRAFKSVVAEYPIVEPVVDLLVSLIDKRIETKIKQSAEKLASTLVRRPDDVESVVSTEARSIVDGIDVNTSQTQLAKYKRIEAEAAARVALLEEIRTGLDERISDAAETVENTRPGNGTEGIFQPSSPKDTGLVECTCKCGGRLLWVRTLSAAECAAQCPSGVPCGQ